MTKESLSSGDFVDQLRQEDELREKLIRGVELLELMRRAENYFDLEPGQLSKRRRRVEVITARDVFCHVAVRILKYPSPEVGACLNIKRSAVSRAVRCGGEHSADSPATTEKLFEQLYSTIKQPILLLLGLHDRSTRRRHCFHRGKLEQNF